MEAARASVFACLHARYATPQFPNRNNYPESRNSSSSRCPVTISGSVQLCLRESTFRAAMHRRGSDQQGRALGCPACLRCDDTSFLNYVCRHPLGFRTSCDRLFVPEQQSPSLLRLPSRPTSLPDARHSHSAPGRER